MIEFSCQERASFGINFEKIRFDFPKNRFTRWILKAKQKQERERAAEALDRLKFNPARVELCLRDKG